MDAVIAGLVAALAAGKKPTSLADLVARLERGVKAREALCAQVVELVPDTSGGKDGSSDLLGLGKVLTSLIEAAKELVLRWVDEDKLTRKTIQTQLETASWSDFVTVPPSP